MTEIGSNLILLPTQNWEIHISVILHSLTEQMCNQQVKHIKIKCGYCRHASLCCLFSPFHLLNLAVASD